MTSKRNKNQAKYRIVSQQHTHEYMTIYELELISCAVQGLSCHQIGQQFGISFRTIESYLLNIKQRFGCRRLTQLIYLLMSDEVYRKKIMEFVYHSGNGVRDDS